MSYYSLRLLIFRMPKIHGHAIVFFLNLFHKILSDFEICSFERLSMPLCARKTMSKAGVCVCRNCSLISRLIRFLWVANLTLRFATTMPILALSAGAARHLPSKRPTSELALIVRSLKTALYSLLLRRRAVLGKVKSRDCMLRDQLPLSP